jgi:threonine/homoserine/homoserine lactone efflux protein
MVSAGFLLTSLIVVLIPGTGVIYTVSTGLGGSRRDSFWAAAGCTLGIVPHLLAGVLGLSAVLHAGARIFQVVRIAGILYLLYLGIGLIRDKSRLRIGEEHSPAGILSLIGRGILLNLLNPKLSLFFFSFLPQFLVQGGRAYLIQMLSLSAVFMGLTLAVFVLYGYLANSFKQFLTASPRALRRIQQSFGLILIGFAAKLALADD